MSQAARFSLVAQRNNSLTSSGRFHVLVFVFTVSVGIAVAFAALGAWPILPFAGLEVLVLFLAFRDVDRRAQDYERIAITDDRVRVEWCEIGALRKQELSRYWAQVVASRDGRYIALRSHGRELAVGRHRSDTQRLDLANDLVRELGTEAGMPRLIHSNRAGEA